MALLLKSQFQNQFALQEVSLLLPESAEIQDSDCALYLGFKVLSRLVSKVECVQTQAYAHPQRKTALPQQAHGGLSHNHNLTLSALPLCPVTLLLTQGSLQGSRGLPVGVLDGFQAHSAGEANRALGGLGVSASSAHGGPSPVPVALLASFNASPLPPPLPLSHVPHPPSPIHSIAGGDNCDQSGTFMGGARGVVRPRPTLCSPPSVHHDPSAVPRPGSSLVGAGSSHSQPEAGREQLGAVSSPDVPLPTALHGQQARKPEEAGILQQQQQSSLMGLAALKQSRQASGEV
jgi:hypothetical protein